jgi:hypothetical protein
MRQRPKRAETRAPLPRLLNALHQILREHTPGRGAVFKKRCAKTASTTIPKRASFGQIALELLAGMAADKNNSEASRLFKKLLKQL